MSKREESENGDDIDINFYFVRFPPFGEASSTADELRKYEEAFEAMETSRVFPKWMDGEDCMKLEESRDYFIVPSFRGDIFEGLCKKKLKVYGAPIIIECVEEEKALPRWNHPVYSSNFQGINLSFTGVPTDERQRLARMVEWMNGRVSGNLSTSTTHLVVNRADSTAEKYKAAVSNKIPMMRSDWIESMWDKARQGVTVKADQADILQAYILPLFHGLVMTLSGIVGEDRTNVGRMAELNGAKLSTTMARATCTHLITEKPTGEKFKKATEWASVKIVTTRWLRKCIEVGNIVDEVKYHPSSSLERIASSTPMKPEDPVNESGPDVSRISGTGGRVPINSTLNTTMTATPSAMTTFAERKMGRAASQQQIVSKVDETILARSISSRVLPTVPDALDQLELTAIEDYDFLEGCMVWLCGVSEAKVEAYRRLLDRTGATRVQRWEAATHVLVVAPSLQEKAELKKIAARESAIIVKAAWIVQCYKQKDFLPTEDYIWSEEASDSSVMEMVRCASAARNVISHNTAPSLSEAKSFSLDPSLSEKMKAILKNEIAKNGATLSQDGTFLVVPLISNIVPGSKTMVTDYFVRRNLTENHPFNIPMNLDEARSLLDNLVFVIEGFGELDQEYIEQIVNYTGGTVQKVISVKEKPGVKIVTHVIAGKENDRVQKCRKTKKLKVIDLSWLIDSVTKGILLPESEYPFEKESLLNWPGRSDDVWSGATTRNVTQEDDFEDEENKEKEEKPFKLNLKLEGLTQALNDIPSPIRTQETINSTEVGNLLKKAAENTGKSLKRRSTIEIEPVAKKSPLMETETNRLTSSQVIAAFDEAEDSFNTADFVRHFLISGVSSVMKQQLASMIVQLGGKVDDNYTRVSTHLITGKMLRSPKALCIVAAGKWCLVPEYITECFKRGGWLKEESFEWNPYRINAELSENFEQEHEFSNAVKKWRKRIADLPYMDSNRWETNGAFMSWRCVLHTDDGKAMKTLEILRAGGASVSTVDSFVDVLSYKPNYVFVSPDFPWDRNSAKRLLVSTVKVLKFEFIYQFLVDDNVKEDDFIHESQI